MPLSSGQQLAAYTIVGPLGAGGMGEVYRALDTRLGREVAVKVLPPEVTSEPGRLERFDREARAIAALNHPHIVTIYSTEEAGGIRFITMELVEGSTLSNFVVPPGMAISAFLDIAMPLADALAAAHQKHITHRDLKPANVMISSDGRLKVLDFGLARVDGSAGDETKVMDGPVTEEGVILGTVPYMSPEQVEGRLLDPRSDLFSLGVIFYEMLAGERPFAGPSSAALMSAILRDAPAPLGQWRPELPEPLTKLIARMLEKRPDDRIQTARDVHNELRTIKQSSSGATTSTATAKPARRVQSIAVLPFADLSQAKDQDWFGDGIAEEILNALSPLPGIRVTGRASSFALRGSVQDLRAIGEKLNVEYVLEGSVRSIGDRVRITAQLSQTADATQLWSERFDRQLTDIFDVQDDIARAIVERLRVTLGEGRLVQRRTEDVQAYELFLRGRMFLTRRGPGLLQAIEYFDQAIARDPDYADAYACLGQACVLLSLYGFLAPRQARQRAQAAVDRALKLDPDHIGALSTKAGLTANHGWDPVTSKALTDRALAADPDDVRTLAESAVLIAKAAAEPASPAIVSLVLDRFHRARAVDPLNAWVMALEAMSLAVLGRPEEAVQAAQRAIAADAKNYTAHWCLLLAMSAAGRDADAERIAGELCANYNRPQNVLAELAAIHGERGDTAAAAAILDELNERSRTHYVGYDVRAAVAASAGQFDQARTFLSQGIADREDFLTFFKLRAWRPLLADPACAAILKSTSLYKNALT